MSLVDPQWLEDWSGLDECISGDINAKNRQGLTMLMRACLEHRHELFKETLSKGADISIVSNDGYNVMDYAVMKLNFAVVKHIISERGINACIMQSIADGMTPLIRAICMGNIDMINTLLLANPMQLLMRSRSKQFPIEYAFERGMFQIAAHLIVSYPKILQQIVMTGGNTVVFLAITHYQYDTLGSMIALGFNCNAHNYAGITPITLAAKLRDVKLVRMLIKAGVNLDAQWGNQSPLFISIINKDIMIAEELLKGGAEIDNIEMTKLVKEYQKNHSALSYVLKYIYIDQYAFMFLLMCKYKEEARRDYHVVARVKKYINNYIKRHVSKIEPSLIEWIKQ